MTEKEFESEALALRAMLENTARRWFGGSDEVEDAVQEVLLKLWNMHGELHRPMAGLARVLVRNYCVDRIRRRRVMLDVEYADVPDVSSAGVGQNDRFEHMMDMVDALPAYQQMILRLRHMEGMSTADIAGLTGSSDAAVRKALSRARVALRMRYFKDKNTMDC